MITKASVQGHPVHTVLVHYPMAFLVGAFLFDLVGSVADKPELWTVAGVNMEESFKS